MPRNAIGNTPLEFTSPLCSNGALMPASTINGRETSLYVDDYARLYLGEKDADVKGFAPVVLHLDQDKKKCINAEIHDVPFKMFLASPKSGPVLTLVCNDRFVLQRVMK